MTTDYIAYLNEYLRNDRVTVSREADYEDENGFTQYGSVDVATAVPCHLSQTGGKSLNININGAVATTAAELRLYTSPDVDIRNGDVLTVTTAAGQVFTLIASRKFVYTTHLEVTCTYDKEVGDDNAI